VLLFLYFVSSFYSPLFIDLFITFVLSLLSCIDLFSSFVLSSCMYVGISLFLYSIVFFSSFVMSFFIYLVRDLFLPLVISLFNQVSLFMYSFR